ncbi:hypothetical protein CVS29_08030 [Arthrobacter psychrochitiniphilus]|uniref:YdbS-like PH domain-containing protein n=1 Tax=Arthrobacter psychrochitiniphilus TaxID=291045 RepID=A0A2V3DS31_9MICC|nr:hypothetical protein CVS29_08030 [Arthrobacter psychrochitiniphilus]
MPKSQSHSIDPEGVVFLPVSGKLVIARFITAVIGALLVLAITAVPLILHRSGVWAGYPAWLAWLAPIIVVVILLWEMILIPRQVRAIGYAERDDDLLIRGGIMFRRVMVVPYGRMQYVDVTMGPLERMLGLSTIHLHTASPGTNALLNGLPAAEAGRLREQLSARGEAKLAGL